MDNTEATRYDSLKKRRYRAEKNAKNKRVAPGKPTKQIIERFQFAKLNASVFLLYPGIHFQRYHRLSS